MLAAALEVLGLQSGATRQQVKQAWRAAAQAHHPDRGGDPVRFRQAEEAFRLLEAGPFPVEVKQPVWVGRVTRWFDEGVGDLDYPGRYPSREGGTPNLTS